MTGRIRRSHYVLVSPRDSAFVDVALLLRGKVELGPLHQLVAVSALTGRELALTHEELDLLLSVPSGEWTESPDGDGCARLVDAGLLLSDVDDERLDELRRREDDLQAAGWSPHAAFFHAMSRWKGVRVDIPLTPEDAAKEAESFLAARGPAPPHFHSRAAGKVVELPHARPDRPLYQLLARRQTTRLFEPGEPLRLEELATLLDSVFGCRGYQKLGDELVFLRKTSPSGGAMHAIEAYPLLLNVAGVESGLYHYDVRHHALELLEQLEPAAAAELADEFTAGQGYPRGASAVFVLAARFERTFWKYPRHHKAYSVVLLDAGHLSQTFYLVCGELGLGAFVTAAINDAEIDERLGFDGVREGSLAVCGCGRPAAAESPVDPEFAPYVPRETRI